jgi:hypothetical protein
MKPASFLKAMLLFGIVSGAGVLGCAHGMTSESTRVRLVQWQANLDDCREVSLSVYQSHDQTEGQPDRKTEELTLEVRPCKHLQFKRVLKRVDEKSGDLAGQFNADEIEIRTDESRQKVWFVDTRAKRVIATLDQATGTTTGPDDQPPPWTTTDTGTPLTK